MGQSHTKAVPLDYRPKKPPPQPILDNQKPHRKRERRPVSEDEPHQATLQTAFRMAVPRSAYRNRPPSVRNASDPFNNLVAIDAVPSEPLHIPPGMSPDHLSRRRGAISQPPIDTQSDEYAALQRHISLKRSSRHQPADQTARPPPPPPKPEALSRSRKRYASQWAPRTITEEPVREDELDIRTEQHQPGQSATNRPRDPSQSDRRREVSNHSATDAGTVSGIETTRYKPLPHSHRPNPSSESLRKRNKNKKRSSAQAHMLEMICDVPSVLSDSSTTDAFQPLQQTRGFHVPSADQSSTSQTDPCVPPGLPRSETGNTAYFSANGTLDSSLDLSQQSCTNPPTLNSSDQWDQSESAFSSDTARDAADGQSAHRSALGMDQLFLGSSTLSPPESQSFLQGLPSEWLCRNSLANSGGSSATTTAPLQQQLQDMHISKATAAVPENPLFVTHFDGQPQSQHASVDAFSCKEQLLSASDRSKPITPPPGYIAYVSNAASTASSSSPRSSRPLPLPPTTTTDSATLVPAVEESVRMHHVLEALFPSKQDSDETQRRAPVATPIPNSDLPFIHLESESASSLPVSHALTMQHRRSSDSPVTSTQTRDADVLLRPIEAETLVRTPRSLTPISIPVRPSRFSSTTGGGQVSEEPILDVADESGYESSSTEVESSGRHGGSSADCSEVPHSVYRPKGSRKRRSRKSPQVPRPPDLAPGPPPAGKKRQLSRIQTRSATRTPPSSRTSRSASEGSRSRDESRKKKSAQPSPRSRSQQTLQVSESRSEDQTYHPMKDERRRKASGSGRWHGERT